MKIKKLNIGSPKNPKLANIGDYWNEELVAKITDLLHEYQNLFPTNFSKIRGIVGDLGEMKIPLRLEAKPSEQRKKAHRDQRIRVRPSNEGRLVLHHDNKLFKRLGKLKTHCLGPYKIMHITDAGAIKLQKLDGSYVAGMVNGSFLKLSYDTHTILGLKKKMTSQRT